MPLAEAASAERFIPDVHASREGGSTRVQMRGTTIARPHVPQTKVQALRFPVSWKQVAGADRAVRRHYGHVSPYRAKGHTPGTDVRWIVDRRHPVGFQDLGGCDKVARKCPGVRRVQVSRSGLRRTLHRLEADSAGPKVLAKPGCKSRAMRFTVSLVTQARRWRSAAPSDRVLALWNDSLEAAGAILSRTMRVLNLCRPIQ